MPQPTCQDTFAAAQQRRRSYPFDAGAYKLREARHALLRMMETIDAIGDFLRKPKSARIGTTLGLCCTTDDKAYWLKNLPKQVASRSQKDGKMHRLFGSITSKILFGQSFNDMAQEQLQIIFD
jgi:hypothetical protein